MAAVHVHNNSQVKKGDLLFELDDTPFRNKVEAAQIALEQARLSNEQLDAQIAAAQASLKTAVLTARNDKVTFDRYQKLSTLQNVSQADLDKVRTTWQSSEQSVSTIQANIRNLRIQRGEREEHRNVTLQKYRNALDDAELNLGWTKVYAQADGTVSNLQLSPGFYASSGSAALALVNNQTDIVADFREKSLRHTHQGTDAAVVFDAFPGHVFRAHVTSSDAGILQVRRPLMASSPSRKPLTAGCAMPSACAFTSRWTSRCRSICRPAPARPCSFTTAKGRLRASSPGCKSTW